MVTLEVLETYKQVFIQVVEEEEQVLLVNGEVIILVEVVLVEMV
jgi:hypothetical protein